MVQCRIRGTMWRWFGFTLITLAVYLVAAKIESEEDDTGESGDRDLDLQESSEHLGASVTQITRHPYAASIIDNDTYICSAVILNDFWLITDTKCFNVNITGTSYVIHRGLKHFNIRVGSSYNNKGGTLYKLSTLINNFDLKVTVIKLTSPLEFNSRVQPVVLPGWDEGVTLGYLATILAWTPSAHMRVVNAPVIEGSICDQFTKLPPGNYICVGGVQDLNRKFCRRDNGGAVIQNGTLIGISSFLHTCALYSRTHAFPKVSSFAKWLDTVIWDEGTRPTTVATTKLTTVKPIVPNTTENNEDRTPFFGDPRQFMLTLPFDPINVPLEPAGDNSVLPRMSLYESYLQNMARAKTSTTPDPNAVEENERKKNELAWMKKYGNSVMMIPQLYPGKRYDNYNEYNKK